MKRQLKINALILFLSEFFSLFQTAAARGGLYLMVRQLSNRVPEPAILPQKRLFRKTNALFGGRETDSGLYC